MQIGAALTTYWGFDTLRPLQQDAIDAAIAGRDLLTVMPTGGGKSLCYQVPPVVTGRLTVVVSPLIALMKDQVDGLMVNNYPAAALYSGVSYEDAASVRRRVLSGEIKLLFVAPERLLGAREDDGNSGGGGAGSAVLSMLVALHQRGKLGAFAIDEAHCISAWGHDFRPEYRRLRELRTVFPGVSVQAYTATATPRVRDDIVYQLGLEDPLVLVGTFDRPNLTYRILPRSGNGDAQILRILKKHDGQAAIVYCISRKETERLAEFLSSKGVAAKAYHAGLSHDLRHAVQDDFLNERLNVVCATVAFGMGIDRSDVRCVIHAASPKSVEAYQQETGRAGRDGLPAECVLLYSSADAAKWISLTERSAAESSVDVPRETVEAQIELIRQMQRLASGARCRHRALSEHFGQVYVPPEGKAVLPQRSPRSQRNAERGDADSPALEFAAVSVSSALDPKPDTRDPVPDSGCNACDVCLKELEELPDANTIAQKIVSCIARLRGPSGDSAYGGAYVADVLRGSAAGKIVERGHHRLSTFGLLRGLDKELVQSAIDQLVDQGFLFREAGQFPVIRLAAPASDLLKGHRTARLVRPPTEDGAPATEGSPGGSRAEKDLGLTPAETTLFEVLRTLRRAIASELGVPPYVVFSDVTLAEIARVRPGSASAFAHVRGVGQAKLEQFGERFVEAVVSHCSANALDLDAQAGSRPRPTLARREAQRTRAAPATAHAAFRMFEKGMSVEDVASTLGRAVSTARGYLEAFIREVKPASIGPWVDAKTYRRVLDTQRALDARALGPIYDQLNGEVGYDQIKLTLVHADVVGSGAVE